MPRLPFRTVDLLLIDEIGKNISGTGMDTNVVGRKYLFSRAADDEWPKIRLIAIRGLTKETHGNAVGIGRADFCLSCVIEQMNLEATRINSLTGGDPKSAQIPIHYPTDQEMLDAALPLIGLTEPKEAKLMWIHNTLDVAEVECGAAYLSQARERKDLEIVVEPRPLPFDDNGLLETPFK
jgi:hypothetical protein